MALPIRNNLHSAEHHRDWYRAPIPVSSSTQNPGSNPEDRVIPRTLRVPGLRLHIGFEPIAPYPPTCLGPYSLSRISRQTRHFRRQRVAPLSVQPRHRIGGLAS